MEPMFVCIYFPTSKWFSIQLLNIACVIKEKTRDAVTMHSHVGFVNQ